ncbi:NAD(P)H-hydrate dehydratase [Thiohalobacter sp.]|uniref:NAD(P)H-hydrate dehydratase n=1 Tax=Thiohalobacter sp. TaxID=2025948 RepID=UPI002613CB3F|nr:NAD(P)H-hydrate dehydratase [Thiohalobacter sp.]
MNTEFASLLHRSGCLPLYRAEQVREMDRRAIEERGIPGCELMSRAGAALFAVLRECWPEARRVGVLCGAGNNGGDGWVVARLAQAAGLEVTVVSLLEPERLQGEAARAARDAVGAGVRWQPFTGGLPEADVRVDALLGTGLARPVAGPWAEAIGLLNVSGRPVIAVDVPSGVDADTGAIRGAAVRAEVTVSFIGRKFGLYTGAGSECGGERRFDDLGVPSEVSAGLVPHGWLAVPGLVTRWLPRRHRNAHKGDFGHVLVVGGQPGMAGAARLASAAALRTGAGLVSLATHPVHAAIAAAERPELMARGVADAEALAPLLARAGVIALGPGLGQGDWGRPLFEAGLDSGLPLVVDADGLNLLAGAPRRCDRWVLTPHPGEAARLLDRPVAEVQADRHAAVRDLAVRYGGVAVLKGAGTLVSDGETVAVVGRGNPGMGSGGMGDLLTGVIAALRAQGLTATEAALLGAWVHAEAGDRAAAEGGERGLLASDLLPWLRRLVNP